MIVRVFIQKCLIALALVAPFVGAAGLRASPVAFASFTDSAPSQWHYVGGVLTASAASADFTSVTGANQALNYSGPVTYSLQAFSGSFPTLANGVLSQIMSGEITFHNGGTTVLDVVFTNAVLSGNANGTTASLVADSQVGGQTVIFTADASAQTGPFPSPASFAISLTQIPSFSSAGTNLNNFTATASGSFGADLNSGAGAPEPSSLALMSVAGLALLRRRKRA